MLTYADVCIREYEEIPLNISALSLHSLTIKVQILRYLESRERESERELERERAGARARERVSERARASERASERARERERARTYQ